jgi:signal transduction histidine kinase
VRGDDSRIAQVVYNLLGNALTYTGENKRVILKQEDRGKRVRVSISDSGKGISSEELPYIWDRYYRTQESHKRAVIGSGLGLNICRGILESHKVPYGVDSTEGVGTTFWFEMEKAG